jgi:Kiwa protein KwaB-like
MLKSTLKKAKQIHWQHATVSFYVIKRRLVHRNAHYDVQNVNVDKELAKKVRSIVKSKIDQSNAVRAYDFNTADLDDDFLGVKTSETDLQPVIDLINGQEEIPSAASYDDLIGSWLYIVRLSLDDHPPLYGARKVSSGWTAKQVTQFLVNAIFENNMLVDIDRKEIFRIDSKIDFFSFDGVLFVADKRNFETALNFREGMERNRDEIIEEFKTLGFIANVEQISGLIGNNVNRLRKLSQVKNSAYYRDAKYLTALKKVNETEDWGLEYDTHGRLVANEQTIEAILKYLNNDRLISKINQEEFAVDVKHKLAGAKV